MKKPEKIDNKIKLWGFPIFSNSIDQLLIMLLAQVEQGEKLETVVTPNPEQVIQATENYELKTALEKATWVIPDGVGLVYASRILAARLKQPALARSIPGREVVAELLKLALANHWKCLLIGGKGYAGQQTSAVLSVNSTPVEWLQGYEQVQSPTQAEERTLEQKIATIRPEIVFVAFGAPAQEAWIWNHQELLQKSEVKLAMAVGGSFDTLLGKLPRPPRVITSLGLEWLYRLILQPWRWRRQLRLLSFIWLVARTWLKPSLTQ